METKTRTSKRHAAPLISEADLVTALAALAHPQRLKVFMSLIRAGMSGVQPGALAAMLDTAPSSLSFQLKELTRAELATVEQQGRNLIYRANFSRMQDIVNLLRDNCCAADPALASKSSTCC